MMAHAEGEMWATLDVDDPDAEAPGWLGEHVGLVLAPAFDGLLRVGSRPRERSRMASQEVSGMSVNYAARPLAGHDVTAVDIAPELDVRPLTHALNARR